MRSCPEFERMLVRSGIQLIKYWFSVSHRPPLDEQTLRSAGLLTQPVGPCERLAQNAPMRSLGTRSGVSVAPR